MNAVYENNLQALKNVMSFANAVLDKTLEKVDDGLLTVSGNNKDLVKELKESLITKKLREKFSV